MKLYKYIIHVDTNTYLKVFPTLRSERSKRNVGNNLKVPGQNNCLFKSYSNMKYYDI